MSEMAMCPCGEYAARCKRCAELPELLAALKDEHEANCAREANRDCVVCELIKRIEGDA